MPATANQHPEQAVVPQDRLDPEFPFAQEEAHLLDPHDAPALEGGDHHRGRLDPPPFEVAAPVGGDDEAHEVLHQQDDPEREKATHDER